jgi:putative transposase
MMLCRKVGVLLFFLNREFAVSAPNQAWVTDITYIPTGEGWLYLAGVKDLFAGELVGYAMGDRMTQDLVTQALFRAVRAKRPAPGLIHHSDRGSQYCAHAYQHCLKQFGMQPSMSRKGDCWDNAPMESFWGTLKTELVHHRRFATREQAKQEITEYIEIFYNRLRKQARLGFLSPFAYTQQYYEIQIAA